MNIKDTSETMAVSWTNTSSLSIDTIAKNSTPWRYPRITYDEWANDRWFVSYDFEQNVTVDSPISRSATWSSSDQKGNHNWPMWMFGAVAGALTFGSIILPLVAGHVYRSISRFSLRKRRTFRAIVSLLWSL